MKLSQHNRNLLFRELVFYSKLYLFPNILWFLFSIIIYFIKPIVFLYTFPLFILNILLLYLGIIYTINKNGKVKKNL